VSLQFLHAEKPRTLFLKNILKKRITLRLLYFGMDPDPEPGFENQTLYKKIYTKI